jgi:hypothetical protein
MTRRMVTLNFLAAFSSILCSWPVFAAPSRTMIARTVLQYAGTVHDRIDAAQVRPPLRRIDCARDVWENETSITSTAILHRRLRCPDHYGRG